MLQETPTSINSEKKSFSQIPSEKPLKDVNLVSDSHAEDLSDNNESINEDDFAENYDDIKSDDGTSKMELGFSPSEDIKEEENSNKPKKFELCNYFFYLYFSNILNSKSW